MTKRKFLVVGDIHGCLEQSAHLVTLLQDPEDQLIFLGDYIDRGPDSKGVLEFVQRKVNQGAIALKGNHEDMFHQFMLMPHENASLYLPQGGLQMFQSYGLDGFDAGWLKTSFLKEHRSDYEFIKNLPLYFETDQFIFVHAGVSPFVDDWRDSEPADFMWIRDWFYHNKNFTNKRVVFGHTPTSILNEDESNDVWISDCQTLIGIDGGLVHNGLLHALEIKETNTIPEITCWSIDKNMNVSSKDIVLAI